VRALSAGLAAFLCLVIVALVVALGMGVVITPEAIERGEVVLSPPCPRAEAGEPCATCGLTRSWMAMGRLRLSQSWTYHHGGPLLWTGTVLLAGLFAWMAVFLVRTEVLPRPTAPSDGTRG